MTLDILTRLPVEIGFKILAKLTIKTLYMSKSVSKTWKALITDPRFIKTHLQKSKQTPPKLIIAGYEYPYSVYSLDLESPDNPPDQLHYFSAEIIFYLGSCNGLLLMASGYYTDPHTGYLWNPSTRTHQQLSLPDNSGEYVFMGLGFDSTMDDLKIVAFARKIDDSNHLMSIPVQVFSSKSCTWKRIPDFPYRGSLGIFLGYNKSIVLDGVPHWVVRAQKSPCSILKNVIMYFDPQEDILKELPSPQIQNFDLTTLGGKLCVIDYCNRPLGFDVWVMEGLWTKIFVISCTSYIDFIRPFELWNQQYQNFLTRCSSMPLTFVGKDDSEILIFNYDSVVIFDGKENKFTWIEVPPGLKQRHILSAGFYVESLVSPRVNFGTGHKAVECKFLIQ